MRKMTIWLFTALLLLGATTAEAGSKKGIKGVKHVVLIGLDGWGAYSVNKAEMPMVKKLMKEGAYTLESRSILPSSSACNWASMIMGAGPEIHGFTTWGSTKPDLPSRQLDRYGLFPTIFSLIREQRPEAETGYLYEWGGMGYLCPKAAVNHFVHKPAVDGKSDPMTNEAVAYIKEKKPLFTMIAFDEPDGVGHKMGHDTPAYYEKLTQLDGCVERIVKAVKEAGMYENTVFIVTADHGGIKKGHGGQTMQEMQIPLIICGKGIKQGHQITSAVMQFDTAATIAAILGITTPQVWIGRPVAESFK